MGRAIRGLFTVVLLVAGCGDDGGGTVTKVDASIGIDAAPDARACVVQASYAPTQTLTTGARNSLQTNSTNRKLVWIDALTASDPPDAIWIELYEGYGAFKTSRMAVGTYPITGEEASYDTCGVCVTISVKLDPNTGEAVEDYVAIGGSLDITSLDPFQGTLSNANFQHIMFTSNGQQIVNDGCATTIPSLMFNAPVTTNPPYTGNAVVSWSVNGANDGTKCPTAGGAVKVEVINAADAVVATTDPTNPVCNASPPTATLSVPVGTYKVRTTLSDAGSTTTYVAEQTGVAITAYTDTPVSLDIICAGCPQ